MMNYEEWKPEEGWKNYNESKRNRMGLKETLIALCMCFGLALAYLMAGTLEFM